MRTNLKPQRGVIHNIINQIKKIMSQSLSKVYVHITFSTKKRYPFIDNVIEQELWTYLGGVEYDERYLWK